MSRYARARHREEKRRRRAEGEENRPTIRSEAAPVRQVRERGGGDDGSGCVFYPNTHYGKSGATPDDVQELAIRQADLPRLSLPGEVSEECLVPLEDVLPPNMRDYYRSSANIVRNPIPRRARKGVHLVSADVYPILLALLHERGMLSFGDASIPARDGRGKPVYNGLFKISKGDHQWRLIMDGRPANSLLTEPENPGLPNPDTVLKDLQQLCRSGQLSTENMLIWKRDIRNFYYRLKVPNWLRSYQCLPPMNDIQRRSFQLQAGSKSANGVGVPVLDCLTMGMSHSVTLAQAVSRFQVQYVLSKLKPALTSRMWVDAYIDDVNIVGPLEAGMETVEAIEQRFERELHLGFKASKNVDAAEAAEIVGVELRPKENSYGVAKRRQDLFSERVISVIRAGQASPAQIENLVGTFAWFALVKRIAYSYLEFSYVWLRQYDRHHLDWHTPQVLWKSVKAEMKSWLKALPMCCSNLLSTCIGSTITDASLYGCGVGFTSATTPWNRIQPANIQAGLPPATTALPPVKPWWFFQFLFEDKQNRWNIGIKELIGSLVGFRRARRSRAAGHVGSTHPKRLTVFGDNIGVLSMIKKGRSKSPIANRFLKSWASIIMREKWTIDVYYVASANNPADIWSRSYLGGHCPARDRWLAAAALNPEPFM